MLKYMMTWYRDAAGDGVDDVDDVEGVDVDNLLQVKRQPATNFLLKTPHWKQVLCSRFQDQPFSVSNNNWWSKQSSKWSISFKTLTSGQTSKQIVLSSF